MISVKELYFSYNSNNITEVAAFNLDQGEHCLFLGASGSGKTTLLHLLAGLLRPVKGEIIIAGTHLNKLRDSALDQFRGKNIGLVFQKSHLINTLSVKDNLYLAQFLAGIPKDRRRVEEVLDELNLLHKKSVQVHQLSHGQAQRVTIARAMLNKPKVILADEPTSSLDDDNCQKVFEILESQARINNATLVISTHDQRIKSKIKRHLILDRIESIQAKL
jgi:ABC-type lipoprotein export system ATPase subunit